MNISQKYALRYTVVTFGPACVVLLGVLAVSPPAGAINIILNYESGKSVNPAQDPTASGLQVLLAHAESYYQDVFEDFATNTTITINFWFEDLDSISTTTWGHHALVNETNSGGAQPWREIEADLRFDNDRTWFIDPTPANDSEFTMAQTLWRDLTGTQQNDFYNNFTAADIPETFEVGWAGPAVPGGVADGVADLLSTVMHEVGHSLGMSSSATGTSNEVGVDADYDFNSNFIFGETLAAEVKTGSVGHIDVDFAMMCGGCAATSRRRTPSHTDLFSMAAGNNYVNLDVPRREFYGGTGWNTPGNWSGDTVPGAADDVFVRDPGAIVEANLTSAGFAANLTVSEGGNVDTNGFRLDIGQLALVTGLNTDLFIRSGGELEATTLRIEDQAEVRPATGGLIDVNTLDINATGLLIGAGTIDVASTLSHDGTITASGGTLTFTTAGGAVWNLDGGGNGVVNATGGNINFASGTLSDAFDGTMTVGVGRKITFANGWDHGTGGVLNLNGGTLVADRAEVDGGAMIIRGNINVDKRGELDGVLTFRSTADVDMPDADDRLDLGNATGDTITYNGGNFTGNGTLVQDGDATVTAGSTVNISVNTFDFDGDTVSDTTILAGATMNITGTGIADAHDGVITINSGTLNVATGNTIILFGNPLFIPAPWEMAGSLVFLDNGVNPVLTGSKVNITGAVSVPITGTGEIDAPVEFHSTSNTEITSVSDKLELNGTTTFSGGTFVGFGQLEQNGNATVNAATTIAVGTYDMDGGPGSTTITLNNDLTLNVTNIDDGNNIFNGTINVNNSTSELQINTPAPWTMAGTLNVTSGTNLTFESISGQDFTLSGTANIDGGTRFDAKVNLTGNVLFATASSRLAVLGGDLVSTNTINGATVSGPVGSSLRSTSGHALVGNGTITVRLDFLAGSELLADNGTLNVPGNFISMGVIGTNDTDGILRVTTAWNTNTATELQLNGGSVTGATITNGGLTTGFGTIAPSGGFSNDNTLTATGGALTLNPAGTMDLDGGTETGTVNLNSDVIVNTTNIDTANNVFNGTINVNNSTSELQINTAAPWTMAGTLNVTSGTSLTFPSITGQDFTLGGTANINGGTRFDAKVNLTGNVLLATGTSRLAVLGGDLLSPNTINGAAISGPAGSSLRTTPGHALVGNGTITVTLDFLTGSELLADNGTLSVPGNFISMGVIGTHDTDGILNVTTIWNTAATTRLELNGGQVTGATITNSGLTTGFGTIATTGGFRNNNTLTANGGTLTLNPVGTLDLDGAANTGTINALTGSVKVSKNIGVPVFAGTLNVGAGQQFSMNFGGLSNTGQINLTGGAYVAPSFNQFGTLTVSAATSFIKSVSSFEAGSTNTLNADLDLLDNSTIRSGASFNGAGSLNVTNGTTLTALDGAVIGVEIVNDGSVILGSSPGTLVVADFTQTALGQIEFELQGLSQGITFDYLKVLDNASIDGLLEVALLGGFIPSIGDSFEIIAAGLSVVGTFSGISFPAIPNAGMGIQYNLNTVTLLVGLPGDLNFDGFVDILDLNIVLTNWDTNATAGVWQGGDPNGDGFIDILDLNVVLANWNSGTPPLIAVPEPASLMLLGLGAVLLSRRRRTA